MRLPRFTTAAAAVAFATVATLAACNDLAEEVLPIDTSINVADYTAAPSYCSLPDTVQWRRDVKPIIDNHCRECHNSRDQWGGVRLVDFKTVAPYARSNRLLGVVAHLPNYPRMPYNRPKLDSCQIATIAVWIAQGVQNN